MVTAMQRQFKEEYIRPILAILFPEFADIINEFYVSYGARYSWITITAKRPEHRLGIDTRTKKEKNVFRPGYVEDNRELIEQAYKIEVGIKNHWQSPFNITGRVSKEYMKSNFHVVCFRVWTFNHSYKAKEEFTKEQTAEVVNYLQSKGIGLPSLDEFHEYYYSD